MIAQTTRDILDQARYFHHQLEAFYHALKEKISQPGLHLILDYLSMHERRMEEALAQYEEDINKKLADTWFKFTPSQSIDEAIAGVVITKEMTLDDLMSIAIRLENHFITLYKSAAEHAVASEVKEVFEQLLKETIEDRLKLSRDLVDMHDLI